SRPVPPNGPGRFSRLPPEDRRCWADWRLARSGSRARTERSGAPAFRFFGRFIGGHMLFYPSEKLALFIDGANLYGAAKGLQFDIDYKRLLELFARKGTLVRAFYYTAVAEDQEFSPLRPLVDWLDYNGFSVVTKPLKEFTD